MGKPNYGFWGNRYFKILNTIREMLYDAKMSDSEKIRHIKTFINIWL